MSKTFITDTLSKSVGAFLKSQRGESIGEIVEITRDDHKRDVEYLIVESDTFFGPENRFFAIPASTRFIDVRTDGHIVLQLHKDDIQFAKGVLADECPKPSLEFGNSIFELYNYRSPASR